jgi:hypothetical protein
MNIFKFLQAFANEDVLKANTSRREAFDQFKKIGADVALAAVPFGLALAPQRSSASTFGTAETPIQALQLALTLEYLENEFYQTGMDTLLLIPIGRDRTVFSKILQHESSHVTFLQNGLGMNSVPKPTFDFTAGGLFNPFGDYQQFLALAQAFEDTGVRAYKGQAANLKSTPDLLQAALQIHSVEARHASEVRRIRGQKGWIVGSDRGGLPSQAQAVYDGEQNTMQAGFNTSTVNGIPAGAGSESFDEPLTGAQATAIASLFIAT